MNARDAMADGGCLTIKGQNTVVGRDDAQRPTDAGRYVLLSVADTGTGMPEQVIERAFEPFFTTRSASSGLGLSLVFGFVRQSGGHISIDSKPGSGTTVRIYLPAAYGDAVAIAPADQHENDLSSPTCSADVGVVRDRTDVISKPDAIIPRQSNGDSFRHRLPPVPREDKVAPVLWHKAENALFASVWEPSGQARYRLIVEPLPRRNGWDWAVWRADDAGEPSRHGRASSLVSAMAAAEDAARLWAGTGRPGD